MQIWSQIRDLDYAMRQTIHRDRQIRWPRFSSRFQGTNPPTRFQAQPMSKLTLGKPELFSPLGRLHDSECSDIRNSESTVVVPIMGADRIPWAQHDAGDMTPDWHLQEWMDAAGKKQADLVRDLGWTRRKASEVYNGDQPYKRDMLNEVAAWLAIEPYELLLSPARAAQLRHFERAAVAIAAALPPQPERPLA